jgi:hypothetical protein
MSPAQLAQLAEIERIFRLAFRESQLIASLEQRVENTRRLPGESVRWCVGRVNQVVRELRNTSTGCSGISVDTEAATWEMKIYIFFFFSLSVDYGKKSTR